MAYMEHAVEPREDLLGHLRHRAAGRAVWPTST
jgi:hypothetical protein